MKRIVCLALTLCFLLAGCTEKTVRTAVYPGGASKLYTVQDIDEAAEVVKKEFETFEKGCQLYALIYAGDEECLKELERQKTSADTETNNQECLVFHSVFHTPRHAKGAWNSNEIYTWSWILTRTDGGPWILIDYGYA